MGVIVQVYCPSHWNIWYFLVTVLLYNVQYIHICKGDIVWSIDKLNTKIGNVFRLHLRIEPFSVMFWALCIVLCTYTKTVDPACRPGIPQQWYLGSIWVKTSRLPVFSDFAVLFIYGMVYQSRIIPIWDGSMGWNARLNLWVWCMLSYPTVGGWGACYQPSANMYLWWWHGVDHGHGWAGHESPQQDHVQARGHYLIVRTTLC